MLARNASAPTNMPDCIINCARPRLRRKVDLPPGIGAGDDHQFLAVGIGVVADHAIELQRQPDIVQPAARQPPLFQSHWHRDADRLPPARAHHAGSSIRCRRPTRPGACRRNRAHDRRTARGRRRPPQFRDCAIPRAPGHPPRRADATRSCTPAIAAGAAKSGRCRRDWEASGAASREHPTTALPTFPGARQPAQDIVSASVPLAQPGAQQYAVSEPELIEVTARLRKELVVELALQHRKKSSPSFRGEAVRVGVCDASQLLQRTEEVRHQFRRIAQQRIGMAGEDGADIVSFLLRSSVGRAAAC